MYGNKRIEMNWIVYTAVESIKPRILTNPYNAEIYVYKPWRPKGFAISNHHKCLSYIFPLHLNTML